MLPEEAGALVAAAGWYCSCRIGSVVRCPRERKNTDFERREVWYVIQNIGTLPAHCEDECGK